MGIGRVKPGDVLGAKYKVERILGSGGMGVVVSALHIDLGQRVALKFMLPEAMTDPTHAERFLREAKAAVQLKSVHTARVLDVGRLANDEPYMVMEYLDGRDLDAELVARGPMPPHVAVDYVLQASEALAEAHALGMVHRDVKLKNLFLTATVDGRPLVKVLDFGLAKTLGSRGDVSLTATNSVFGSPQYMSPEQMRSAKDVDNRSDIWSMGVCLYELLTGHVPFDAAGVAEICAMVLKDPVTPPSRFVDMPPDLENAVLRCLEKDAAARFQSFAELALALEDYAADEGSARRILNVMQSAHKVEAMTTRNAIPSSEWDAGPKTLNAWDSGGASISTRVTPFTSRQMGMAIVGCVALAIAGAKIGISALQHMQHDSSVAAGAVVATESVTATATTPTAPFPPPFPPPVAAPGAPPGAAPAPIETSAAAGAAGAATGAPTATLAVAAASPTATGATGTIIGASPAETLDPPAAARTAPRTTRTTTAPTATHPAATPTRGTTAGLPSAAASSTKPTAKPKTGPGEYM